MDLLAVSGSLQAESSNSALLRALRAAAPSGVDVTLWEELGELPHFRPDHDGDVHVESLRRAVAKAGVVVVATPEYAGGMPGALKNALDWLVGSGELYRKAVVIVSAAPSAERGHNARRWVAEVVGMQRGVVLDSFTVAIERSGGVAHVSEEGERVLHRVLGAVTAHAAADAHSVAS